MKFSPSIFAAPTTLVALLFLANCSSDTSSGNTAGAPSSGGSNTGGSAAKGGAAGSSGGSVSVGGTSGGSVAAGGTGAGGTGSGGVAGGGVSTAGAAGTAAVEASFNTVKNVIMANCFGSGCHNSTEEGNPLQMPIDSKLYMTLTTHVTAKCGKVVNLTSPADSAIVKLLKGDCNGTSRMPFQKCFEGQTHEDNEACVSDANIAAIQAWIAKGAPQ